MPLVVKSYEMFSHTFYISMQQTGLGTIAISRRPKRRSGTKRTRSTRPGMLRLGLIGPERINAEARPRARNLRQRQREHPKGNFLDFSNYNATKVLAAISIPALSYEAITKMRLVVAEA